MDTVKLIRAKNIKFLIESRCQGNKSEFARRIKSTPQHVSKILRVLDPDAESLKETAKKYVGDDVAGRAEQAFGLDKGSLSKGLMSDFKAAETAALDVFGSAGSQRPLIAWDDIERYLSGDEVDHVMVNLPALQSSRAFLTRLPEHIGSSIADIALPNDLVAVEPDTDKNQLVTGNYILSRISRDNKISCWKVKRIGPQILLVDEDYPERPYDGDWHFIGSIKFSIKGL
ncbi:hypothetical protein [Serratia fonticola]|uniref:hypothetical protein n=1 Tax=Serratia fonticola TaxID=47917 RepID=UPI003AAE0B0E|nr:hypothetical protein [Serratia fonticola]HBE9090961.1 hypothetical protein [Serratia fonticola]